MVGQLIDLVGKEPLGRESGYYDGVLVALEYVQRPIKVDHLGSQAILYHPAEHEHADRAVSDDAAGNRGEAASNERITSRPSGIAGGPRGRVVPLRMPSSLPLPSVEVRRDGDGFQRAELCASPPWRYPERQAFPSKASNCGRFEAKSAYISLVETAWQVAGLMNLLNLPPQDGANLRSRRCCSDQKCVARRMYG